MYRALRREEIPIAVELFLHSVTVLEHLLDTGFHFAGPLAQSPPEQPRVLLRELDPSRASAIDQVIRGAERAVDHG